LYIVLCIALCIFVCILIQPIEFEGLNFDLPFECEGLIDCCQPFEFEGLIEPLEFEGQIFDPLVPVP
jgi:hypothetical protein